MLTQLEPLKRHQDVKSPRSEGAGLWLLNLESFIEWKNTNIIEESSRVFCCYGIPGAGKTVIRYVAIFHTIVMNRGCIPGWQTCMQRMNGCSSLEFASRPWTTVLHARRSTILYARVSQKPYNPVYSHLPLCPALLPHATTCSLPVRTPLSLVPRIDSIAQASHVPSVHDKYTSN